MSLLARLRTAPASAAPVVALFHKEHASCASCRVRESCLPGGLQPDAVLQIDELAANRKRLKKRNTLYRPGDAFAALYAIRVGTFKTLMLAEDGREQIMGYHIGGEIVGFDGVGTGRHASQAIALEDSEVCVLPFEQLDELARKEPEVRRNLFRLISRDMGRRQDMMLLLGSMCAEERLAVFLLNLADRYRKRGYSASELVLRMTREEIASYLGLTLETVSRLFSRLQGEGLIQVRGRAVELLDPAALKRLAGMN